MTEQIPTASYVRLDDLSKEGFTRLKDSASHKKTTLNNQCSTLTLLHILRGLTGLVAF
ncbi:MAG: hypothetical protein ACFFDJ_03030 [Candidatus Odinarchaeota archaeon]